MWSSFFLSFFASLFNWLWGCNTRCHSWDSHRLPGEFSKTAWAATSITTQLLLRIVSQMYTTVTSVSVVTCHISFVVGMTTPTNHWTHVLHESPPDSKGHVVLIGRQRNGSQLTCIQAGAYWAGEAGKGACNSYIDCIDIKIQTWPTFTTFSNVPIMALTGTFT